MTTDQCENHAWNRFLGEAHIKILVYALQICLSPVVNYMYDILYTFKNTFPTKFSNYVWGMIVF